LRRSRGLSPGNSRIKYFEVSSFREKVKEAENCLYIKTLIEVKV